VTFYLLDENVLREMRTGGDARVRAWLATVNDTELRISALTFFEKRRGWSRMLKDPARAEAARSGLAKIDALEEAYEGRIVPIDAGVAAEWAALLGAKDKHQRDMALAATARVHGMVVVTRNVKDFVGRQVLVLDPFNNEPKVELV